MPKILNSKGLFKSTSSIKEMNSAARVLNAWNRYISPPQPRFDSPKKEVNLIKQ